MNIGVIGVGYVGLVSGACFAKLGHTVLCMDIDQQKIDRLKQGDIPIYEPGLQEIVLQAIQSGNLLFTTSPEEAVTFGNVVFNAVGTPPAADGHADLKYVYTVAESVGTYMEDNLVLINKSTVPVGTGKKCLEIIKTKLRERGVSLEADVVSNPEFLKEGSAIKDFLEPERVVIGYQNESSKALIEQVYAPFLEQGVPFIWTDVTSSELIKYAANSFLATKISFINEIANFSSLVGANVLDVADGIGLDSRIGKKFLNSGIGYGGSCFPKDVKALVASGDDAGYSFEIIKAAESVNKKQKSLPVDLLQQSLGNLNGKTIAVWGVSFKPNTDDVRDSVSHIVFDQLIAGGVASIVAHDPVAIEEMKHMYGEHNLITYSTDKFEALQGADALVVLTEWNDYKQVTLTEIAEKLSGTLVVDGRNIRAKNKKPETLTYVGIGV